MLSWGPATAAAAETVQTTVSFPAPASATDGFENCASGTNATNRSESAIAVDPTDSSHLLSLSKFFFSSTPSGGQLTDWSQVYRFHLGSYDIQGGSASNQQVPGYDCVSGPALSLPGWDATTDPNVGFDAAGNAYTNVLGINVNNSKNGIFVSKKPAGSARWQKPVEIFQYNSQRGRSRGSDKQWIAVDSNASSPFSGNVYAAWTIFSPFNTGVIYFSRSTDGGQTFSTPHQLSNMSGNANTYVYLDIDARGTLYVEYTNFGKRFATGGTAQILVSTDGGQNFSGPFTGPDFNPEPFVARNNFGWTLPNTTFRDGIEDYFAASHSTPGNLYIVSEQWDQGGCAPTSAASGDYDVGIWRSADGGQTWQSLGCANDPATQGDMSDQFQPQVATDAAGHVAVAWYDRRNACPTSQPAAGYYTSPGTDNYCIQTGLQWYDDLTGQKVGTNVLLGPSWDPQQPASGPAPVSSTPPPPFAYVSDLPHSVFNPCYSFGISVCVTFIGDYFALAVNNGTAYLQNVSTFPTAQNGQTVEAWSQAPPSGVSPSSVQPALNDYYQQQVLMSVAAPRSSD